MSKTDRTRPYWVQERDPLLDRFKMVGNLAWSKDGTSENYWKKLRSCSCWACGGKKYFKLEKRQERVHWRKHRQYIIALVDRSDIDVPSRRF